MNNQKINKKFSVVLFFFVCMNLILLGCGKNSIDFPNGYRLEKYDKKHFYLIDDRKNKVIDESITEFNVHNECIYGWLDNRKEGFFFVNTKTKEMKIFDDWRNLDHFLKESRLPILKMSDSFTFWDIAHGYKQKTW